MVKAKGYGITVLVLGCLLLVGCSESKDGEQSKASGKPTTEQAADKIKAYGANRIDKARDAQQMGNERTDAIDEALKKQ